MKGDSLRQDDTIVARATPQGRGGVAVVRISGPQVAAIANGLIGALPKPRYAALRDFADAEGASLDQGLALYFPAPNSFTGEDVLELHGHGGPVVTEMLIERVVELGGRRADPGEFSRRAFLNDKLDLSQAEAIADLIDSASQTAARAARRSMRGDFSTAVVALNDQVTELRVHVEAAMDFPEEDIDFLDDAALRERLDRVTARFEELAETVRRGCLLRDGVHVVLVGRPNAGKSSVLNALSGYEAAIVTDTPGTTRDLVREQLDLDGLPVHVIDTAGLRGTNEAVEREGIRRAHSQLADADHALLIVDAAAGETADELRSEVPEGLGCTVVRNKVDLTGEAAGETAESVNVSALTGEGMDALRRVIERRVGYVADPGTMTARQRHLDLLRTARAHFDEATRQLLERRAGELMADELRQVQDALAAITGEFGSDDLLGEIFGRFCIGK